LQKYPKIYNIYTVFEHLETALHVSCGVYTNHRECLQLYQKLLVFDIWYFNNGCMHTWWCVAVPPKMCRTVSRYKYSVYILHLVGHICWNIFTMHVTMNIKVTCNICMGTKILTIYQICTVFQQLVFFTFGMWFVFSVLSSDSRFWT
jgi:hypothetical protein